MMPCHHDDIMLMSHVVPVPADVSIDFDQFDFLPVWKNEQNAISFAYDVCLSPFKLCWVRNDEAYTRSCFEAILSTFIFRPSWTHFGSWIHFGSEGKTSAMGYLDYSSQA
jgi:hypothetical protein